MKQYLIYALENYGTFYCTEILQPSGEILLIGKFFKKPQLYTFIKQDKDKKL